MSGQLTPLNETSRAVVREQPTALVPHPPLGTLAAALASARDRCKGAAKEAVNVFHKYRYASADEIISTASEALEGSGLGLVPLSEELTVLGSGNTAIYALNRTLLLAHSSGETVVLQIRGWPIVPERGRPLDKAYAIALTTSLSYKLRDLLQMPRVDPSDDLAAQRDTPAAPPAPHPSAVAESVAQAPAEASANPQPPPPAQGQLSEQEYEALVKLAREHRRTQGEIRAICAGLSIPTFNQERISRARLPWVREALTWGLVPTETVDRISQLVEDLGLNWDEINSRLMAKYQVSSLAHLLPSQAGEVEMGLKGLQARRAQAQLQPAAAPP